MTFALNPTTEQSQAKFQAAAIETAQRTKDNGLSAGAKAGIAIAVIVPTILLAILAIFFVRRRKRAAAKHDADHIPSEYYAEENKSLNNHGAYDDMKDGRPVVPPKTSEMPGNEQASELPGYTTHEMDGSPGANSDEGPSPLTPPTSKEQIPKRKPVYTHYNEDDD